MHNKGNKSFCDEDKVYRNNWSTLMKQSKKKKKKNDYSNSFKSNIRNVKNIWKGIKSITFLETRESKCPKKKILTAKVSSSPIQKTLSAVSRFFWFCCT